ncbi:undecaprenyldiphospho-muramoylpentapeptide beta-N- acetylglucosaminyltransferase [Listeria grayi FSL F6-1183]|uniref:Undecaprenyldiphospho-muramoylpentapeptide beta-N-acetylglucosaminyltransferase n=1 Tax=Listeria grayi FSL F6-1183 TaxID=1265827 RepID=A0A829R8A0_LISGR|nr:undecaprenyldiphospho-muramoylpentapeptide beta-N- acetylglucosaminyltransferase [Listeria grayi FSL F6-1183]
MKIAISGGGTGGHIYPALALVRELKKKPSRRRIFIYRHRKGTGK